jgi:hypothetical protein
MYQKNVEGSRLGLVHDIFLKELSTYLLTELIIIIFISVDPYKELSPS